MPESRPRRRWYHLSPDRLIIGLLAVEGFLFLSEHYQWFASNEKKGWTVLIAVAAVCLAVVVMLLWFAASLFFKWRFQFSVRSLVVLVVAVAIPLGWFGIKMREAERQRRAVEAIGRAGGWVLYDCEKPPDLDGFLMQTGPAEPPAFPWLTRLVGIDFFADVVRLVFFYAERSEDATLECVGRLTKLEYLVFSHTQVSDEGLKHLRRLTRLRYLHLTASHVLPSEGIKGLQEALPNCRIHIRTTKTNLAPN